jgi:outer membrane protein TolC
MSNDSTGLHSHLRKIEHVALGTKPMKRSQCVRAVLRIVVRLPLFCSGAALSLYGQNVGQGGPISMREAIDNALLQNRELQIEQINPVVAETQLATARGYYDPLFTTRYAREEASDTGAFDPLNPAVESGYEANSDVISAGFTGFLPSGLTYNLNSRYVHSSGTRNFLNFDSYKVDGSIYAEQPLLRNFWIDLPRWQIQVAKQNLKVTELGVQFIAMSVVHRTQIAYYDLAYLWEHLRILQTLVQTRQELLQGVQQRVRLGAGTSVEEKFAQSQWAAVQTELVLKSNEVAIASNNLRTMMGVSVENWTQVPLEPSDALLTIPETLNLSESWRAGLRQRPDLLQLEINAETANITLRYWRNQLFPFLNLFGGYGLRGSDAIQAFPPAQPEADLSRALDQIEDRASPNSSVGILFSLPLSMRRERAGYSSSKELRKQAELLVKQKEEFVLREVADAIDNARFSYERAAAARESVRHAVEAAEAEEIRQARGASSMLLVFEAQEDVAQARITEAAARRDYNKALSLLYFAEGSLLERIQLDVNVR